MTASAAAAYPACGRDARQDARFCDACGSPISSGAGTAEYKQVTVLFADVLIRLRSTKLGKVLW